MLTEKGVYSAVVKTVSKDSKGKTAGLQFDLITSFTKCPSAEEQRGQVSETQSARPPGRRSDCKKACAEKQTAVSCWMQAASPVSSVITFSRMGKKTLFKNAFLTFL